MKKPLYIIDGYAFIFRSYFAFIRKPLINSEGFNVSAIHGFTRTVLSIIKDYKPKYLSIALDSRTLTFRDKMYAMYKQTRDRTPEDLRNQFPVIEELLKCFHLPTIRHNGVEADDIIASLAHRCRNEGRSCVIVSGDKDLYQLVDKNVSVLRPAKYGGFERLDSKGVFEDKGVRPDQIVDYLSLLGDSVDNIPGVKGIGQKTTEKLLAEFDSLDGIYSNLDSIDNANWRKKLKEGVELAQLSKSLVVLKDDIEFDFTIDDLNLESLNGPKAAELLETYQMQTLSTDIRSIHGSTPGAKSPFFGMDKIDSPEIDPGGLVLEEYINISGATAQNDRNSTQMDHPQVDSIQEYLNELKNVKQQYDLVRTSDELQVWIDRCRETGIYAFDTETNNLDPVIAELVGFSLSNAPGCGCYVPLRSPNQPVDHLSEMDAIAYLKPLLEDVDIKLVGQNIKYDYKIMARRGIIIANPFFDTLIAAWLLDTTQNAYSMDTLAEQYLDYKTQELKPLYEKATGKKLTKTAGDTLDFSFIPLDEALFYAAEDADITFRLYQVFEKKLENVQTNSGTSLLEVLFQLEMPLIPILSSMELNGILLNANGLQTYSLELEKQLKELERKVYDFCGHEFNIASTKQLQVVLFKERGLKPGKKTKTGYSTDISVLEDLAKEDIVPKLVLQHRLLAKLKSTYVDTLPTLINDRTRRIHTRFQQNGTATGRISSHDPNLQNIPIRDEEGRRIRSAFIPRQGCVFVSADYSQIELVVLAHLSADKELTAAFKKGVDVHAVTGSLIFQIPVVEVNDFQRRIAKMINFGVMYGMSSFRLSREIGISRSDAQQFIDAYFNTYAGIRDFIETSIVEAEKRGFVETILGRRRPIPAIRSSNRHERMGAERVVVNTQIQGSAADIVKVAMINIDRAFRNEKLKTKMLLQVHDELIFETPENEVDRIKDLLVQLMPSSIELSVPLKVNIEVGSSWGSIH